MKKRNVAFAINVNKICFKFFTFYFSLHLFYLNNTITLDKRNIWHWVKKNKLNI